MKRTHLAYLFLLLPLMAGAWGWKHHQYRLTFSNGDVLEPVHTESMFSNYKLIEWNDYNFYQCNDELLDENIRILKEKHMEKHSCGYFRAPDYSVSDNSITYLDVEKIEMID